MSPYVPDGIDWPADAHLDPALAGAASPHLALYVHVPFCTVRCGYCDFNTYTVGFGEGADRDTYDQSVIGEVGLAARTLAPFHHEPVKSIFFGGGTPTLLQTSQIAHILRAIKTSFALDPNAEITVEANPDSVDERALRELAEAGVTRVSFGMQSAVPHVLRTLERTHNPEQVPRVVRWARAAGLDASVDLIYGTPGESLANWRTSLEAAIALEPDHISTYALVIEQGTKMWAQVSRGDLENPDPDDEAAKYELADQLLSEAGFAWYEISNWARLEPGERPGSTALAHASKHNLAYWFDWDWWGFGPGAHSHVGNLRWWNRKHPRAWADALFGRASFEASSVSSAVQTRPADHSSERISQAELFSPAKAGEILTPSDRVLEAVLLKIRTADGISIDEVDASVRDRIPRLHAEGMIEDRADSRIKLTLKGRLLADYVTRELTV